MDLRSLVCHFEAIVPSSRAESWDNVGLLVEPSGNPSISHVLLTVDLTEQVLDEAKRVGAELVVAYHPPIFRPLKRLTQHSVKERIIVGAVESRVAVYSPHTALDCMEGGVNDWLLAGLGQGEVQALSIQHVPSTSRVSLSGVHQDVVDRIAGIWPDVQLIHKKPNNSSAGLSDIQFRCSEEKLASLLLQLKATAAPQTISLEAGPVTPEPGGGRRLVLEQPIELCELVARVKAHLSLSYVRLARPAGWTDAHQVRTVAACAGSGAAVLATAEADVLLTGEMSHHDTLAAVSQEKAVILCEHSNTERGFLIHYRSLLLERTGPDVTISLAKSDTDPLVLA